MVNTVGVEAIQIAIRVFLSTFSSTCGKVHGLGENSFFFLRMMALFHHFLFQKY